MEHDNIGNVTSDNQLLVFQSGMNKSLLKRSQYTLSLLNEGQRAGLLNHQEVYSIQNKMLLILQGQIRRYTQGESSSVTTETSESILTSVMYAVDAYLLNFKDHNKAIT